VLVGKPQKKKLFIENQELQIPFDEWPSNIKQL
jgi:hypothetical protein